MDHLHDDYNAYFVLGIRVEHSYLYFYAFPQTL